MLSMTYTIRRQQERKRNKNIILFLLISTYVIKYLFRMMVAAVQQKNINQIRRYL